MGSLRTDRMAGIFKGQRLEIRSFPSCGREIGSIYIRIYVPVCINHLYLSQAILIYVTNIPAFQMIM